ncbi:MAG: LamG domain-containing protein [bacterium]
MQLRTVALITLLATCLPGRAITPLKVNTHDLDLALSSGIHCMSSILNPDDRDIPYFYCNVMGRPQMAFDSRLSVGNVTGRTLYALLKAGRAAEINIDPAVVNKYRKVLIDSYQVVRGIPANPDSQGAPYTTCWIFNDGAGFRGLLGLAEFRNDSTAIQYYNDSIANCQAWYINPGYSWQAFQQHFGLAGGGTGGAPAWPGPSMETATYPFRIWSLVKYYEAMGHVPALDMAVNLANVCVLLDFPPNGSISGFDHGFELVAQTNAVAEVAYVTSNSAMMNLVRARYDNGQGAVISRQTGWVPETISQHSDVGEINNTAEVIETALRLGDWGWPQYYQDAERFTRAHLLPAQLLDISFINPSPNPPPSDSQYMVRERVQGAYGFPSPYGHMSTQNPYFGGSFFMDIVAGGVATVAEVKKNCCRFVNDNHYVNLLFDFENGAIRVQNPYASDGLLTVTLKTPGMLRIRLSSWVDRTTITVSSIGSPLPFSFEPYYLKIASPPVNQPISIKINLPVYYTDEILNGRTITTQWKGDSVLAMMQMGSALPFFPEPDLKQRWLDSLGAARLVTWADMNGAGIPTTGTRIREVNTFPAPDRNGQAGKALGFNGTSSFLAYRTQYFPDQQYTLLLWFNPQGMSGAGMAYRQVASAWAGYYDDPARITIRGTNLFAGLETSNTVFKTSNYPLENEQWRHVAIVKDGASFSLYLDGAFKETIAVPAALKTLATDYGIGCNPHYSSGEYFQGATAEHGFYARPLSAGEIADIYHGGPSKISLWRNYN